MNEKLARLLVAIAVVVIGGLIGETMATLLLSENIVMNIIAYIIIGLSLVAITYKTLGEK